MNINNVIEAKTIDIVENENLIGFYYNHLSDIIKDVDSKLAEELNKEKRIKVLQKFYKDLDNYRRYVSMSVVTFDDKPFMIIQNGGREGDDYEEKFIFDKEVFLEFSKVIVKLNKKVMSEPMFYSKDVDINKLETVYNHKVTLKE